MLRPRKCGDLRRDALDRADSLNKTDRFTPASVNEYLNQSIAHLRDMLIQVRGQDYFSTTGTPIPMVAGTTIYSLPNDCYTLLSFRIDLGGGSQYMLESFGENEEAELRLMSASSSGALVQYRLLSASQVELLPQPPPGSNLYVRYIPSAPRLVDDEDLFDGFNGWEEFVILDAARKIATKEKDWETVNALKADIAVIVDRIKSLAGRRDKGRPERVKDVRAERRFNRYARYRWGL